MKIGIFYFSTKPAQDRQIVWFDIKLKSWAYIRVQVVEAENEEAALDMAEPQDDEDVMNTHELRLNV